MEQEGYVANQVQKFGYARKYHQDWNVFGNFTMLNSIVRPLLPRYTAKDIKGFKTKYNVKDKERLWVNHFHRVLQQVYMTDGRFDVTEFFKPSYYKTYKKLMKK